MNTYKNKDFLIYRITACNNSDYNDIFDFKVKITDRFSKVSKKELLREKSYLFHIINIQFAYIMRI